MSLPEEICIVSGLPRSGTSLMMQMLVQGGVPPLVDEIRTPDPDNPRGYFEFEGVKKTKENASWLSIARGKAVKVVSQLLYDLPETETYRIVFMRRDMAEIISSQNRMLIRRGRDVTDVEKLATAFQAHLEKLLAWLAHQEHIRFLEISYNDIIDVPDLQIERLEAFLGRPLDRNAMRSAVDPLLYRNRSHRSQTE